MDCAAPRPVKYSCLSNQTMIQLPDTDHLLANGSCYEDEDKSNGFSSTRFDCVAGHVIFTKSNSTNCDGSVVHRINCSNTTTISGCRCVTANMIVIEKYSGVGCPSNNGNKNDTWTVALSTNDGVCLEGTQFQCGPPARDSTSTSKCGSKNNPDDVDCCAPNGEEMWCHDGFAPRRTGKACGSFIDGDWKDDPDGMFTCDATTSVYISFYNSSACTGDKSKEVTLTANTCVDAGPPDTEDSYDCEKDDEDKLAKDSDGQMSSCKLGVDEGYCDDDSTLVEDHGAPEGWFRSVCCKSCSDGSDGDVNYNCDGSNARDDEDKLAEDSHGQMSSCKLGLDEGYCHDDSTLVNDFDAPEGWFRSLCCKTCTAKTWEVQQTVTFEGISRYEFNEEKIRCAIAAQLGVLCSVVTIDSVDTKSNNFVMHIVKYTVAVSSEEAVKGVEDKMNALASGNQDAVKKLETAVEERLQKNPGSVSVTATVPETTEPKNSMLMDAAGPRTLSAMAMGVAATAVVSIVCPLQQAVGK